MRPALGWGRLPAALFLLSCAIPSFVFGQELAYTGGIQFATGRYLFETRTNSAYVLSGLDLSAGPVRLGASIPVVVQSTPWITYGPVPLPSGGQQAGEVTRQSGRGQRRIVLPIATVNGTHAGLGDPLLRADVELARDSGGRPSIRVGASAKAPLASIDDGFGTGEWDYGAGLTLSKQFGPHTLSGDVAFWRFGDLDDLALEDAWAYGLSYGRRLAGGRWSLLASGSGYTTIIPGEDPPVQVGVGIGRIFSSRRAVTGTVSVGVTDTAPDVSVGFGWRVGF
jgi:hypothetical protein